MSAFGQIISLKIRSNNKIDTNIELCNNNDELDYCTLLNKTLPLNIRIIGSCYVTEQFNARFSANSRKYRYFFMKNNLNIELMQKACKLYIGLHDFRNFCKMDVINVTNYSREIFSSEIRLFSKFHSNNNNNSNNSNESNELNELNDSKNDVYVFEVQGIAFLWHMVRCLMSILLLIGNNKENINIITELFNIENNPSKPNYKMAEELPLVLHECGFDNLILKYESKNLWNLMINYNNLLNNYLIGVSRIQNAINSLNIITVKQSNVMELAKLFKININFNNKSKLIENKNETNELNETNEINELIENDKKRIRLDNTNNIIELNNNNDNASDVDIQWSQVVELFRLQGIYPESDTAPYVPLLKVSQTIFQSFDC